MTLKLAPDLELPDEAVTQTFGILAKRGAGKSNAGAVMAEEMHKADLPFVVVDPVGAWWGLRADANGKPGGLHIPIFGGNRGDVPLEPGSGRLMADLIVEKNLSAVLDVSSFDGENQKRRFLADFAERLYTAKGKPGQDTPLHLFLEEADDYIPQKATGEVARCLGAFERIVKRGRARGLGATMITQRSASLNKDVLTQIETLIVLRIVSPTDRKPIADWVTYHGQAKEILASLQELAPGEAWVWSMWLDLTKRVQIRRRRTFDSGQTPSVKAKRAVATLADVDLPELGEQIAATIEKAKAEDPRELHKRIRELERDLSESRKPTDTPEPVIERVEVPVMRAEHFERLDAYFTKLSELVAGFQLEADTLDRTVADPLAEILEEVRGRVVDERVERALPARATSATATAPSLKAPRPESGSSPGRSGDPVRPAPSDVSLGKGEKKVLAVLRQWPDGRTYNELAFLAGYSAKASTLGVILSKLRQADLVEPGNQPVRLTGQGLEVAGGYEPLPTGQALLDHWRAHPRMGEGERRVLDALVDAYPIDLTHEDLCAVTGYSPIASTMGVILSKLRKLGLVEKGARRLAPEFAEAIAL